MATVVVLSKKNDSRSMRESIVHIFTLLWEYKVFNFNSYLLHLTVSMTHFKKKSSHFESSEVFKNG